MTIRLGGELTIDRVSQVFAQFAELLVALHEHQGANVEWMLDGLEHGSASATAKAIPLDDRSKGRIPAMCDEYIQAARKVASGWGVAGHRSNHLAGVPRSAPANCRGGWQTPGGALL